MSSLSFDASATLRLNAFLPIERALLRQGYALYTTLFVESSSENDALRASSSERGGAPDSSGAERYLLEARRGVTTANLLVVRGLTAKHAGPVA